MPPLTVTSNIASIEIQQRLGETTRKLQQNLERLSSGLRINHAKDDTAGLAIATGLSIDRRVLNRGLKNLNDGISYLNIAEKAVGELKGILIRLGELSTQSSNGTITNSQRQSLNDEAVALTDEYNRIVNVTEFNGINLFSEHGSSISLQVGYGENGQLSVVLASPSSAPIGDGTFQARTSYGTGLAPYSVAIGDLNGDGIPDLVSADSYQGSLSVRLGNGDGSLQERTTLASGGLTRSVVITDLNGDGRSDIVFANANDDQLGVYLGYGDGTFQAAALYEAGDTPWEVKVGDFNNDGITDIVSSDYNSYVVSVFIGNGDGTFKKRTSFANGQDSTSVSVGDINGDGKLDIVSISNYESSVSVFLGNGNGTFTARQEIATGSIPVSEVLADLNGDGTLDIVTVDMTSNSVSIFLGNGNGTFQARKSYITGATPTDVTVGDLNGDGVPDLVVAESGVDAVSVLIGNGNGTFKARVTYAVGDDTKFVIASDISGDGVLDLITADSASNAISVLLGNYVITTQSVSIRPLSGVNLATQGTALASKSVIDRYLDEATAVASTIGGSMSRLQITGNALRTESDILAVAESRIVDVDTAEEAASLVKNSILQQAEIAILGQANQSPGLVLKLLGGGSLSSPTGFNTNAQSGMDSVLRR